MLTRERSDEEKRRRHLYGDKGAKFSGGKVPKIDVSGVMGTVTTLVTKDLKVIEADLERNLIEKRDMSKILRIRKLTSRECFRAMGVGDEDIDKIKAAGISESQQYKLAGNSIVVPVLEGIFTQMFRADDDCLF